MPRLPVILLTVIFIVLGMSPAQAGDVPKTYLGMPCTKDCSGHRAGYEWAKKKDIKREEDCGGTSNSFREGCRSFVKEQRAQSAPSSVPEK